MMKMKPKRKSALIDKSQSLRINDTEMESS